VLKVAAVSDNFGVAVCRICVTFNFCDMRKVEKLCCNRPFQLACYYNVGSVLGVLSLPWYLVRMMLVTHIFCVFKILSGPCCFLGTGTNPVCTDSAFGTWL
jgi:hypothetical protein